MLGKGAAPLGFLLVTTTNILLCVDGIRLADFRIARIRINERCCLRQFNLASRDTARGPEAASLQFEARRRRLEPFERGFGGIDGFHGHVACGHGFGAIGHDEAEETTRFEEILIGLVEEGVCAAMCKKDQQSCKAKCENVSRN